MEDVVLHDGLEQKHLDGILDEPPVMKETGGERGKEGRGVEVRKVVCLLVCVCL